MPPPATSTVVLGASLGSGEALSLLIEAGASPSVLTVTSLLSELIAASVARPVTRENNCAEVISLLVEIIYSHTAASAGAKQHKQLLATASQLSRCSTHGRQELLASAGLPKSPRLVNSRAQGTCGFIHSNKEGPRLVTSQHVLDRTMIVPFKSVS